MSHSSCGRIERDEDDIEVLGGQFQNLGLAPSSLSLFMVIPLQAIRSNAIYGDPSRRPGQDWRPQIYQAAQVGIGAFEVIAIDRDPTPSDEKYRKLR